MTTATDTTPAALPPVRSEPMLAELFADLQRIDETSILPDGDWVSVCVSTWAAEWVKRLQDAGLITANNAVRGAAEPRTLDGLVRHSLGQKL